MSGSFRGLSYWAASVSPVLCPRKPLRMREASSSKIDKETSEPMEDCGKLFSRLSTAMLKIAARGSLQISEMTVMTEIQTRDNDYPLFSISSQRLPTTICLRRLSTTIRLRNKFLNRQAHQKVVSVTAVLSYQAGEC